MLERVVLKDFKSHKESDLSLFSSQIKADMTNLMFLSCL
jgi:hypothetical protein